MDENCDVCGRVAPLRIAGNERRCPQCRQDWRLFIESGGVPAVVPEAPQRNLYPEVLASVILGLSELETEYEPEERRLAGAQDHR